MITYLHFSVLGEIEELKTKHKILNLENFNNFSFKEKVLHNTHSFIILFNKNTNEKKNITSLPFYKKEIIGDFLLFKVDENDNLKSLTENKFLKLINISQKNINDYSSDDFNLSDE
jgi:hypothetical protein